MKNSAKKIDNNHDYDDVWLWVGNKNKPVYQKTKFQQTTKKTVINGLEKKSIKESITNFVFASSFLKNEHRNQNEISDNLFIVYL